MFTKITETAETIVAQFLGRFQFWSREGSRAEYINYIKF